MKQLNNRYKYKNKLKLFSEKPIVKLLFMLIVLASIHKTEIKAQSLFIKEKSGVQNSYTIENINKLDFSEARLRIDRKNENPDSIPVSDIRYINFSEPANKKKPGIYTKTGFFSTSQDSFLTLKIDQYRGEIQWQKTVDNKNWATLEGQNSDSLQIRTDEEAMYRAKITEGSCLPVYSDSVLIATNNDVLENYVVISETALNLVSNSSEIASGKYIYTGNTQNQGLKPGQVIIDEQSGGTIRKIVGKEENGDTLFLNTEQATMEDIFYNTSFKLSSLMLYPEQNLKSANLEEIVKALTDADGYLHPLKTVFRSKDGTILKSTSVFEPSQKKTGDEFYIHHDFSGKELISEENTFTLTDRTGAEHTYSGNIKAFVSEGYITFDPEFKYDFGFTPPSVSWSNLDVKKGKLNKFAFYCDSSLIDFKAVLTFDADIAYDFGGEYTIVQLIDVNSYHVIPCGYVPIPVWINYTIELKCNLSTAFGGGLSISKGFQNTDYISLGARYENGEWETINKITKENKLISAVSGYGKAEVQFDVYPEVNIKLYSLLGPYFKMGPFLQYNMELTLEENWDKELNLGASAGIGVSSDALSDELESFLSGDFELFNVNLWQSPVQLIQEAGNNQKAEPEETLPEPIVVKVVDSRNQLVSDVNVYFQPLTGGVVSEPIVKSDENGVAQTIWTLSEKKGKKGLKVFIKNGKNEEITGSSVIFSATAEIENSVTIPEVSTSEISGITQTTAITGGNVTSDGDTTITARGVCWSLNPLPTLNSNHTEDGSDMGSYISNLSGLWPDTVYFVRAYATNSEGTAYGQQLSFRTLKDTTSTGGGGDINYVPEFGVFTFDGKSYKTTRIGNQWWMAENLAYLPAVSPGNERSDKNPLYYVQGYNGTDVNAAKATSNYIKYGVLYNWKAALTACPGGWHLPTKEEWDQLAGYISSVKGPYENNDNGWENVGQHLKAVGAWPSGDIATDDFGFTALPGGYRFVLGFTASGAGTIWWSSSIRAFSLVTTWNSLIYNSRDKEWGYSIRCIQD